MSDVAFAIPRPNIGMACPSTGERSSENRKAHFQRLTDRTYGQRVAISLAKLLPVPPILELDTLGAFLTIASEAAPPIAAASLCVRTEIQSRKTMPSRWTARSYAQRVAQVIAPLLPISRAPEFVVIRTFLTLAFEEASLLATRVMPTREELEHIRYLERQAAAFATPSENTSHHQPIRTT
jgi:hypothetical protein